MGERERESETRKREREIKQERKVMCPETVASHVLGGSGGQLAVVEAGFF